MGSLEKIPSWLRWILFLPAGLIIFFLAYPIIMMGNYFFSMGHFENYWGRLFLVALAGGWSAFLLVWVGARVAPRAQFLVSIILAVLYGVIVGFGLMGGLILRDRGSSSLTEVVISCVAGLIGSIVACYSFYEKGSGTN